MNSPDAIAAACCLLLGISFAPTQSLASPSSFSFQALPNCGSDPSPNPGCRGTPDFDNNQASTRLNDLKFVYWIEGNTLRMAARTTGSLPPRLCCSLQDYMKPLGQRDGEWFWGAEYILPHLNESILYISPGNDAPWSSTNLYRGPKAPADAGKVKALKGQLTTVEIDSKILGEPRKITIYKPAAKPPAGGYPVIYIADGVSVTSFASRVEKMIDDGKISPVLLIGIWASDKRPDEMHRFDGRSNEYMPDPEFDPQAYARHEEFVLKEVMPLAEDKYSASTYRDRRMTFGFSNGASWAISFAARHPDLFDQGSGMAAGTSPESINFTSIPKRFQLFVGAGEYDLLRNATRAICDKATNFGIKCQYTSIYTGHDGAMWDYGLEQALTYFFHPSPFN